MKNPWTDINPPGKDVSARRIDHTHALDLFWARDHLGHYLFIYEFTSEEGLPKINPPDLAGIKTLFVPAHDVTCNRLILLLNEETNWEIFLSLCNDLVQATRPAMTSVAAVQAILRRLGRWHELLKKNRSDLLSEEQIKGLIGELLFIKNYLIPVFGAGQSIRFWQGPEGLPQDFNVNDGAIEVKCRSGASSPYVKISSVDQLCPQLPEMYLFVVTLGKAAQETTKGINLPGLISYIRNALESNASDQIERFNDHLYLLGYTDSDRYLDFNYVLGDEKIYKVTDGFPRLCSHELPHGIANLTYDISLAECDRFEQRPGWMEQLS